MSEDYRTKLETPPAPRTDRLSPEATTLLAWAKDKLDISERLDALIADGYPHVYDQPPYLDEALADRIPFDTVEVARCILTVLGEHKPQEGASDE